MPLSLVEMECTLATDRRRMPRATSMTNYHAFTTLHSNQVKSTIVMFVAEFLTKVLREESSDPLLYQYIEQSLTWLDTSTRQYSNFHLVFLMRMTHFIGIEPPSHAPSTHHCYFDLMGSEYTTLQPLHQHYLTPEETSRLRYILHMNYDNMHLYPLSHNQRRRILEIINTYYSLHLPAFGELKSLEVLRDIFA